VSIIATTKELCALPELARITAADGKRYQKFCDGKPTENPNWIFWEHGGGKYHTDEIALPADLDTITPYNCKYCGLEVEQFITGWTHVDGYRECPPAYATSAAPEDIETEQGK
jgi:hypothetical protein